MLGNVFSPYYAAARRRGPADPDNHCALNVALYGKGGKRWAMVDRPRHAVMRDAGTLAIGRSRLAWDAHGLCLDIDEPTVPIPGRIRGQVRVRTPALCPRAFCVHASGRHAWQPLCANAAVEVTLDRPARRWRGHAYLDHNAGTAPLERDFRGWHWSRAPISDRTAVLYDATGRDGSRTELALLLDRAGNATPFAAPPETPLPRTLWRIDRATRSEAPPRVARTLEDTPFYARSWIDTTLLGERTRAFHESLDLDRFASRWVQVLLPFRMQRQLR
jgi:carotenoid 1,2-hydratase